MKKIVIVSICLLQTLITFSQAVAVNATGSSPDASSILDVSSNTKGMLLPRMTQAQRNAIASPANGLFIYQTDGTIGLYCNTGTPAVPNWQMLGAQGPQGIQGIQGVQGPAGTSTATEYAYIFNTSAQFVTVGNPITFDTNGQLSSGITHNAGSSFIFVNVAGRYRVDFSVSANLVNQISVYVNGVSSAGSKYGTNTANAQNSGFVLLNLNAGDVVQLNCAGSPASINLNANIGGTTPAVNASIMIMKM
ncbi:MAG TPA: hypothetical protein VHM26_08465 [Chitinophagaceae bacterium]|jgi:hypothetical protein|nr:hypothetical protein [Chitinophagaceae bacterium]